MYNVKIVGTRLFGQVKAMIIASNQSSMTELEVEF